MAIDFKSIPSSKQHLAVVVDYFSRYVEIKILNSTTAEATEEFLMEIFARHGIPYSLTSDNGPPFSFKEFNEFCDVHGIIHHTTPPCWAQANGEVERQNRSLQKVLQVAKIEKIELKKALFDYLLMYRATPHSVTGKSPAELMFNRKIRDKLPTLKERVEDTSVRDADSYEKAKSLLRARNAVSEKDIVVGDEVLVQRPFSKDKGDSKFESETGTVTAVNGPEVVVKTPTRSVRRHKNQIERYNRRADDAVSTPEDPVTDVSAEPVVTDRLITRQSDRSTKGKTPGWLSDYVTSN